MDTDKTEYELTVGQSAEALWKEFERTGSVDTYLLFARKNENPERFELAPLTFLS